MASHKQLDAARRPAIREVIVLIFFLLTLCWPASAQNSLSENERLAAAQKALDAQHWEEAAQLARGPEQQNAELDFIEGMALARLGKWEESRRAFEAGHKKEPTAAKFLVEMAGVSYKQKNYPAAKRALRAALRLNAKDEYARDFLGTIYFLEGNLEAALKYWNPLEKPRLHSVAILPSPKLREELQHRAVTFHAPQVLTEDALLATDARLDSLGIFPGRRTEIAPVENGNFDATLHLAEKNGIGDSKLAAALSILGGLPYETIYPEYFNFQHRAMNFTSLLRWDSQKRRANVNFLTPLFGDPAVSLRVYADARNENWNLSETFFGTGTPLTNLNLRRVAAGGEIRFVESATWNWSTGIEVAHRSFRNVEGLTTNAATPFFTKGTSLSIWARGERSLLRIPQRRFTVDSTAEARLGREFVTGMGAYATLRGGLRADWLPQAKGDDYQMQAQIRAGATAGHVPFDELFQIGIERDNDLWLRGTGGTTDGRKGAAPLGRRYFLMNWEQDKNIFDNGLFAVKLGPFFDTGAIADSSELFGSRRWIWDPGVQCKVRVLGSVMVVFSYGRDLHAGKGAFYGTLVK